MHNVDPSHLTELRVLLKALGTSGGLISPSVYDSAQVLRLAPHRPGADYTWTWLLAQQQSDGGWGNRAVPCARDLPTLAAVAALAKHRQCPGGHSAIQAGLTFLRSQHIHWSDPLPDDIPVGIELLLPHLLADAARLGLDVPQAQYAPLVVLGDQRRRLIAHVSPGAGSAASYSWEAWGTDPNPALIDGSGGVGHSPAATAAWLAASIQQDTMDAPKSATDYLAQAAAATVQNQPGLMPTVWPINRFEQVWVLYTLFMAGLLAHPALDDLVWPHLCELRSALGPNGIGMSDYFVYDGDITATTLAILHATGHDVDWSILHAFQEGDHYRTYTGELQPSLTTTAHAMLALALSGADVTHCVRFLIGKQQPDGRWIGDKWHSSWLYTTAQVLTALAQAGQLAALPAAIKALLREQHPNGGWGMGATATLAETAYAALALSTLRPLPLFDTPIEHALQRAFSWLSYAAASTSVDATPYWIGKELYCPYRVDQACVLGALLALAPTEERMANAI